MAVNSATAVTTATTPTTSKNSLSSLKTEDFLKLIIAQLSNQNPLEPMENDKLLEQVTNLNSLTGTQSLIETLKGLTTTQSLGSASNLIGRNVTGIVNDENITGVVDRAVVEDGQVYVMVGENKLSLDNVSEIK